MSNLKLAPDEPTPLERLLLDASRSEQPSDDHKARLRAALGIGAPLSGSLASPSQIAAPGGNGASTGATTGFGKSAALAKLALGVGALGVAGALWFLQRPDASPPLAVRPAPVVQTVPVPAEPSAVEVAPPAVSPLPPVEQPASAPRARAAASVLSTDDLGEQIRLIEAARAGVAARDSQAALVALGDYSAKFPRGSFGQEASVLRIRALDQAGDSARATAMAKAFIARFPNSPHVARLKPIAERGASR